MSISHTQTPQLLRRQEVEAELNISRATIYRWINKGDFPAPIRLSKNMVRWNRSEVKNLLAEKGAR